MILKAGEMLGYESARLVHSRQQPLRGHHYDNVFIHYQPRGLWYQHNILPDDPVMKISAEAVRWSQRRMVTTDWDQAWSHFLLHQTDRELKSFGFGDALRSAPDNLEDEEDFEEFVHIR